jgi:nucleotide-binding universal stress UspA family protein
MFKTIKSILFATNLQENCRPAFDFAVSLATKYQATIVLLHVLEKRIPDYVESRLKGMLGEEEWNQIKEKHEKNVRSALIAKKSTDELIRDALEQFCNEAGIDDASCGFHSKEIVIGEGELVDEIIDKAKEYKCEMIIMGAHPGIIRETSISSVIKGVLHRSKIPVVVVPPEAA